MLNLHEESNARDRLLVQTRSHHVQLSVMADVKANIMLTLSSLVLTFSFRYLNDPILRWPVVVMIIFCIITIVVAAYAVMPKISSGKGPSANKSKNLLFFGNFIHMDYEEYAEKMDHVLSETNAVYEAQVREVYEMGVFLGQKKYRFVRLAYISFISGLVSSGLVLVGMQFFI
ncbi:MAG: Pycsar system effector family protein [Chloroflexota bacterium]